MTEASRPNAGPEHISGKRKRLAGHVTTRIGDPASAGFVKGAPRGRGWA